MFCFSKALNQRTKAVTKPKISTSSSNRRLTIMLLVVSITFVVVTMPIVTIEQIKLQKDIMNFLRAICLTLQYINHSCNFFLYALTGKTFRKELIALFGKQLTSSRFCAAHAVPARNYQLRNRKTKRKISKKHSRHLKIQQLNYFSSHENLRTTHLNIETNITNITSSTFSLFSAV